MKTKINTAHHTLADLEVGDLFRWADPKDTAHGVVNIILHVNDTDGARTICEVGTNMNYVRPGNSPFRVDKLTLESIEARVV